MADDSMKSLGEVIRDLKAQAGKPLTRQHRAFLDAAAEARLQTPEEQEDSAAFTARQLVLATLPHSDPGDVPVWERTNGSLILTVRPGWNHEKREPYGFPYGTIPRLLLYWITTEALYTGKPRLELGDNLAGFMRELGLDPTRGGKRSDAARLRDQMQRLFQATISFHETRQEGTAKRQSWLNMQVAPEGVLWWDTRRPEQLTLWKSWIELSPQFFHAITASPIPANLTILRALKRSPLALDLYAWANYAAYQANRTGKARFVPWAQLHAQFGAEYSDIRDFRRYAKAALTKIKAVYHTLQIGDRDGGVEILPTSHPSVPPRPRRRLPKPDSGTASD